MRKWAKWGLGIIVLSLFVGGPALAASNGQAYGYYTGLTGMFALDGATYVPAGASDAQTVINGGQPANAPSFFGVVPGGQAQPPAQPDQ